MTSLGGLPVYLDLAFVLNLGESISTHLQVKVQGWTDEQIVMSFILLNLAGGDSVDDFRILEADRGVLQGASPYRTEGTQEKGTTGSREKAAQGEASIRPFPLCRLPRGVPTCRGQGGDPPFDHAPVRSGTRPC